MARKRRRASFFVSIDGVATPRATGSINNGLRYRIFARDKNKCRMCGVDVARHRFKTPFLSGVKVGHVDHIVPIAVGGQHDEQNLQLLCEYCNESKGADYVG